LGQYYNIPLLTTLEVGILETHLNPPYRVRVRGIYATAIASLLLKNGYVLSDLSEVLKSRISRPSTELPPHVTLKTDNDKRDEILIIGYPWESGKAIEEMLKENFQMSTIRRGRYGINTIVRGKSLGDCKVLLPGGNIGVLKRANTCPNQGEELTVSVVKEKLSPRDSIILSKDLRIVGMYVILIYPGQGISFSEHIHDENRKLELAELASKNVDISSFHIRFRSSSRIAQINNIEQELRNLLQEKDNLLNQTNLDETGIIRRGEYISVITLSQIDKRIADELRAQTTPTIAFHHTLKAGGRLFSDLVDYAEHLLIDLNLDHNRLGYSTLNYVVQTLRGKIISIRHIKPDGDFYNISPGRVESVELKPNKPPVLVLKRVFKTPGILDGLNVEKRPGDYDIMRIDMSSWRIVHEYYTSSGDPLGIYVNINTPPEVEEDSIKYVDLYIDVVLKPSKDPEIVDQDQLDKAYEELLITKELYGKALAEAKKAHSMLSQIPL
jgi:Ribonuclease G/E